MLFLIPMIFCFYCCSISSQQTIQLKPYETWWEDNFDAHGDDFADWIGGINADSRVAMRKHVKLHTYKSILDVPSGLCTDYFGLQYDRVKIYYQGLDITPKLVDRAIGLGVRVKLGSIENIPWDDSSFDIVYARHILEHLRYYDVAIKELIRVAKKEVLIVFFRKPHGEKDIIYPAQIVGTTQLNFVYHNTYNKHSLKQYILSFKKVKSLAWENVNNEEIILHIYMVDNSKLLQEL